MAADIEMWYRHMYGDKALKEKLLNEMLGELVDISEYTDEECERLDQDYKLKNILK